MSEFNKPLRERLLNMETPNSMQGGTHREQVRAILDAKLTVAKRIGFGLLALVGALTAIGLQRAYEDPGSSGEGLVYCLFVILAVLLSAAWTILTGWAAISGVVRRTHRPWIVVTSLAMGFCYLVLLVFIFVVPISHQESRVMLGTQFALVGFFLLNTIGLCVILGVLYRGQFRSQEKLLEIEYQLADLAERIGNQPSNGSAGR